MLIASTRITPPEVEALHNLISYVEDLPNRPEYVSDEVVEAAYKFLSGARSDLHKVWSELPEGNHLREAYTEEAWKWDDTGLTQAFKEGNP